MILVPDIQVWFVKGYRPKDPVPMHTAIYSTEDEAKRMKAMLENETPGWAWTIENNFL